MSIGGAERPRRRRHGPKVWAAVRKAYLRNMTARECHETFGVSVSALRDRARREGWTKTKLWAAEAAELRTGEHVEAELAGCDHEPGERDREPSTGPELDASDPVVIADAALNRALEALDRGRAAEAQSLIKAGNAVGEFAEFVKALKREREAPPE